MSWRFRVASCWWVVPVRSVLGPLKAFTTADFSFGAETDHWGVDFTISNAFDERGDLFRSAQCTVQTCGGTLYTSTNQPRTIGIKLTHKID